MKEILLVNPRPRRRGRRKTASKKRRSRTMSRRRIRSPGRYRRRSSPLRRYRRRTMRRRRNPIRAGNILSDLMPALQGAAGAIVTETAYRFIPAPGALAMLKGPMLAPVTKLATAYGVSMLARTFLGRRVATNLLSGALVVIAYDFVNQQILSRLPAVGSGVSAYMDELGYHSAGAIVPSLPDRSNVDSVGAYMDESNVGAYIS